MAMVGGFYKPVLGDCLRTCLRMLLGDRPLFLSYVPVCVPVSGGCWATAACSCSTYLSEEIVGRLAQLPRVLILHTCLRKLGDWIVGQLPRVLTPRTYLRGLLGDCPVFLTYIPTFGGCWVTAPCS